MRGNAVAELRIRIDGVHCCGLQSKNRKAIFFRVRHHSNSGRDFILIYVRSCCFEFRTFEVLDCAGVVWYLLPDLRGNPVQAETVVVCE